MDIWDECNGSQYIQKISKKAWRVVEDQAKSATRKLVSSREEHDILEEILEASKPEIPNDAKGLHYLLFTPFRYPPLKYGSRFGDKLHRSLLYASLDIITALTETAFYRFSFLRSSHANLGSKVFKYTSFQITVQTLRGVDLTEQPFSSKRQDISSQISYQHSQPLGEDLRKNHIEACISFSARNIPDGKNINIFSPKVLYHGNMALEKTFEYWECFATKDVVEFSPSMKKSIEPLTLQASDFFVAGAFPSIPQG